MCPNCIWFYSLLQKVIHVGKNYLKIIALLFLTLTVFLKQTRKNHLIITKSFRKSLYNKTPIIKSPVYELRGVHSSYSPSPQQILWCSAQLPLLNGSVQGPAAQQERFTFSSRQVLQKSSCPFLGGNGMSLELSPHSHLLKKLVTAIMQNGILLSLFLDLTTLNNICVLITRKIEEFCVHMPPSTLGFLKLSFFVLLIISLEL